MVQTRYRALSKAMGLLLMMFSLSFAPPAAAGHFFGEPGDELAVEFGAPGVITLALGLSLFLAGRQEEEDLRDREALLTVPLAWLLVSLLGSLPYVLSGALTSGFDAFFESISGLTTTGATVIPYPERLPHSILLWRAETQLIGGMGIIMLSMMVLASLVGGSTQLFRAEALAYTRMRIRPTVRQIAGTMWTIYLAFIGLEAALLSWAGMGPFDAICHSFSTVSTGGFSTRSEGLAFWNITPVIGTIVTVFMVLGGMSFITHYEWIRGRARKILTDPEAVGYILILVLSAATIALLLALSKGGLSTYREIASHAAFNTVSIMTSTGFATSDYTLWPSAAQILLIFLMMIGGCSASTAGGMKVIRFVLLVKMVRRELHKAIHPRAVIPITLGGRLISENVMRNVVSYFFIYVTTFCAVAFGLCVLGMTVLEGLATSASALGNVGPSIGAFGPTSNYLALHPAGKMLMCVAMWMGRLEIYPALLLISPGAYRD
ncbi:MAG: TrkH family potassium uptake protein [Thermoplasmatota archaeon]